MPYGIGTSQGSALNLNRRERASLKWRKRAAHKAERRRIRGLLAKVQPIIEPALVPMRAYTTEFGVLRSFAKV